MNSHRPWAKYLIKAPGEHRKSVRLPERQSSCRCPGRFPDNQTGILQTRIDRGAESLTKLVQSAFIDILPLFASSILALVIMFYASS